MVLFLTQQETWAKAESHIPNSENDGHVERYVLLLRPSSVMVLYFPQPRPLLFDGNVLSCCIIVWLRFSFFDVSDALSTESYYLLVLTEIFFIFQRSFFALLYPIHSK